MHRVLRPTRTIHRTTAGVCSRAHAACCHCLEHGGYACLHMVNHQFDVILDGPTWVTWVMQEGRCSSNSRRPPFVILTQYAELSLTLGRLLGEVAACQLERLCTAASISAAAQQVAKGQVQLGVLMQGWARGVGRCLEHLSVRCGSNSCRGCLSSCQGSGSQQRNATRQGQGRWHIPGTPVHCAAATTVDRWVWPTSWQVAIGTAAARFYTPSGSPCALRSCPLDCPSTSLPMRMPVR